MIVHTRFLQLLAELIAIFYIVFQGQILCHEEFNAQYIDSEGEALLKLKDGLKDPSNRLSSWIPGKDCCQWEGVECNRTTGHVISLDLHTQNTLHKLSGELKPSLLDLPYLSYLDLSGNDFLQTKVPEFLGSLRNLEHLNLSGTNIRGTLPDHLGNLSHLQSLDLSANNVRLSVNNLDWLSSLSSLKVLDFSKVLLKNAVNWLHVINTLPSLEVLRLSHCGLPILPFHLAHVNITSLKILDLSSNSFSAKMPDWLFEIGPSLQYLNLSNNELYGRIPDKFENLKSLAILDLSYNNLSGTIPSTVGQTHGENELGLKELHISNNHLSGRLEERLMQLSQLSVLDVARNDLKGIISDAHLRNFSSLKVLDLSSNYNLKLHVSKNWTPPFDLETIGLGSVELGPQFPNWLQSQKNLSSMNLSDTKMSGSVPDWFWNLSPRFEYMDLSNNNLSGCGLTFSSNLKLHTLDLSKNKFSCPLPVLYSTMKVVDLHSNSFFGSMSHVCNIVGVNNSLDYLDLSSNNLSGNIPNCWTKGTSLALLDLSNNYLTGRIPDSLGNLNQLTVLSLNNNTLSGQIPVSLQHCVGLYFLDVGENKLSGNIPRWIGESWLYAEVLSFRSNLFEGNIPWELCQLKRLFILDLAQNHLMGHIPPCLFDAMNVEDSDLYDPYNFIRKNLVQLCETTGKWNQWACQMLPTGSPLQYFSVLDLSSNELEGTIPREITKATGLQALNLSGNQLVGSIPSDIGEMTFLEALDLSRNQLSCAIPSSMVSLTFLGVLILSYNNLSGQIPVGTQLQSFDPTAYEANPHLCGRPLTKSCPRDKSFEDLHCSDSEGEGEHEHDGYHQDNNKDKLEISPFYISMGIGFITGFWVFWGSLLLCTSWRYAYFRFLASTNDWIYVTVVVALAKLRSKFQTQQVPNKVVP